MKVREVMSNHPTSLPADASIRDAARLMQETDIGALPISHNDRVIGLLTDRDITVGAVAKALSPETKVSEIINGELIYCFEEDEINEALAHMRKQQVQRLIVLDNDEEKDMVGMLSLADVADHCDDPQLAQSITECCRHY